MRLPALLALAALPLLLACAQAPGGAQPPEPSPPQPSSPSPLPPPGEEGAPDTSDNGSLSRPEGGGWERVGARDRAAQPTGSIAFETLVQQSNPGQTGETVRDAARDEGAWAALWAKLREGSALPGEPPAVDFRSEMVIAVAMETQGCVSKVTIRGIVREGNRLVVDLLEAPPAPNCVCITSERPIHVVRLPRVDGPVRFEVERGQTSC